MAGIGAIAGLGGGDAVFDPPGKLVYGIRLGEKSSDDDAGETGLDIDVAEAAANEHGNV